MAISPAAIIAAILLLFSARPRLNGLLYLAGWVLGLLSFSAILVRLPLDLTLGRASRAAFTGANLLRVLLGALFLAAALSSTWWKVSAPSIRWKGGSSGPSPTTAPRWP